MKKNADCTHCGHRLNYHIVGTFKNQNYENSYCSACGSACLFPKESKNFINGNKNSTAQPMSAEAESKRIFAA